MRLFDIAANYDAFILDLWGVIHDGVEMYPSAAACLAELHAAGKHVVFLSNAPRRAVVAEQGLKRFGVPAAQFERVITSGEVAHHWIASGQGAYLGDRCVFIGLEADLPVLQGLSLERVAHPDQADFIFCAGYDYLFQPPQDQETRLKKCAARNLPMLCINPDYEVVRQDGSVIYCAGHLARRYEELGGKITYIGKPHKVVYDAVFEHFAGIPKDRILAVGDSLHTDIAGANAAGIASALITGGILKREMEAGVALETLFTQQRARPEYVLPAFVW